MEGKVGDERRARFVCVTAIARQGRVIAVVSDFVEGVLANEPRGTNGFGYDPVFCFPETGRTYAEASQEEKNRISHRGKTFRKICELLSLPNYPRPFLDSGSIQAVCEKITCTGTRTQEYKRRPCL